MDVHEQRLNDGPSGLLVGGACVAAWKLRSLEDVPCELCTCERAVVIDESDKKIQEAEAP